MKRIFYTFISLLFTVSIFAQPVKVVKDTDLGATVTNWSRDTVYQLDGYVFVEPGGVLNIQAGTVIRGQATPSTGDQSSALIITRGAQIYALGTREMPVIFTAELDDLTDPGDLTKDDRGLWGGLIMLGNGIVGVDGGEFNVEGIPSSEGRATYGGNDNAESSGILRYVSIRHGGAKLEANNEINGLTLAGVGSGTEINYIEVFANLDDGIEWFGGAANVKHAAIAFCGDDCFDYDQSWDGKGQFWFSIQDPEGNRGGEWDGSEASDLLPKVSPMLSNCTFIGDGTTTVNPDNNDAMRLKVDGAAHVNNSIFTSFVRRAIVIDDANAQDSWDRFLSGETTFEHNLYFDFGAGSDLASIINCGSTDNNTQFLTYLNNNSNTVADPMIAGISRSQNGGLDPRINDGSPALGAAKLVADDFFDPVPYIGAFGNRDNWALGWTALDAMGFFGNLVVPVNAPVVVVRDQDINAGDKVSWTADNTYLLDGYVFVEDGAMLTIEPGTVIKGKASPSTGDKSSALIITRGAMIMAEGREDAPIIFTAEFDDLAESDDLTKDDRGLWGGLILLGRGIVGVDGGTFNVEGIPSSEGRAAYGGSDNTDNSGILKYVSIRHGGDKLEANNEINGLTLGGVGSGTEIDYVEVFANLDDGIEFFGGAVNVKHAAIAFCGDDCFDYDQSWDGKGQFWFAIQDPEGNRGGEWDGSEASDLQPKVAPLISNCTFIGSPTTVNPDNNDALRIRADAAAHVSNSIFTDFTRRAIVIDDVNAQDSWDRFVAGDITFDNNLFFQFGAGADLASIINAGSAANNTMLLDHLNARSNSYTNPLLAGISRSTNGGLDPRINDGSPALGRAKLIQDDYFDPVPYAGAFGNRDNWALNWTALDEYGYFGDLVVPAQTQTVVVRDQDINAGQKVTWTADKEYLLDGYVFVEDGAMLTINPGTVVKGKASPSTGDKSSALIITRGAMLMADGRADAPIIFTAEFDDLNDQTDLTKDDRGLWGGLILLGKGVVGVDGGVFNVEGIPSSEGRAAYGGNDNADNSGVLRYISIRHGGDKLEANNEINGLTLGGVGSSTVIDHIEVFANLDDGVELFGGAVNIKHFISAFCGDDSYDYDQSWAGKGQFWFSIQDEEGNRGGEWDGSEASDLQPKVVPLISNCTFIGSPTTVNPDNNDALRIRADAAAKVYNSIFTDFTRRAIVIDDVNTQDSWDRFLAGDIAFSNNVFFQFGAGADLASIINAGSAANNTQLLAHLNANNNNYGETGIGGISRQPDGGLDPRIDASGIAWGRGQSVGDPFFDNVDYIGAFSNTENWALGWTALDWYGYFGSLVSSVDDPVLSPVDDGMSVYPNPATSAVTVSLELPAAGTYSVGIVNQLGQLVQRSTPMALTAGSHNTEMDVHHLSNGIYLVTINDASGNIVARRILVKN